MALGNVFNEPRRELTESAVGIAVSVVPLAVWWFAARWCAVVTYNPNHFENGRLDAAPYFCWAAMWLVIVFAAALLVWAVSAVFLYVTHEIGESICDKLQTRGIHLRPLQRPGRRC